MLKESVVPNKNRVSSFTGDHPKHKPTQKVIKFIGNLNQNIDEVIDNVQCCCGAGIELRQILKIYAKKLVKVRRERDLLKEEHETLIQSRKEVDRLNRQVEQLRKRLENSLSIYDNYSNSPKGTFNALSELSQLNENIDRHPFFDSSLHCSQQSSPWPSTMNNTVGLTSELTKQKCDRQLYQLLKKYNLSIEQLKGIIQKCRKDATEKDLSKTQKLHRKGLRERRQPMNVDTASRLYSTMKLAF